jgi:hypothetical protein
MTWRSLTRRSLTRRSLTLASLLFVATAASSTTAHAEDVVPTRVQLLRLAEAELDAGRPAEAATTATRVIEDPPQRNEGAAEVAAWERAREVFVMARARAAHLTVGVTGGVGVIVEVDGTAVSRTSDLLVDPGEHVIVARSEGFDSAATSVRVRAGESRGVALTLVRRLAPSTSSETIAMGTTSAAAAAAASPANAQPTPDQPLPPARIAAFATLGTGLTAVIVGSVAAVVTVNRRENLAGRCPNGACPPELADNIDAANTWGKVSTAALITGGVLLGTSGVLFLTSWSSSSKPQASSPSVSVNVGPGSAFVSGKF